MTGPDGQELRARYYLRRLGARPLGHQEQHMSEPEPRPITPTRVIPAGAPLPARAPEPGEMPPWRTPPPAPPAPPEFPASPWPPAPPPGPIEVHVTVDLAPAAEPEPEPDPWWARLWDRLVTRRMLIAIGAALTPWAGGDSPVGIWAHTVHQARTEAGIFPAYIIAGVALGGAWLLDRRTGRVVPRFLLVTASVGALGVLHWWDPIHALTGVDL